MPKNVTTVSTNLTFGLPCVGPGVVRIGRIHSRQDQCWVSAGKKHTRTYVTGTDVYPHMPILCAISRTVHHYGNVHMRVGVARALADSSDFGLLGGKVHKNGRFPAFDADVLPCKI